MSEHLAAVAAALDTPEELIERSAAARAAANGTTAEEVLASWAGGVPAGAPAPVPEPAAETPVPAAETVAPAPEPELAPAAVAVVEGPPAAPEPVNESEPEEPLEPVPLGRRVRTATRVGAWTGAALGLFGLLIATAWWAPDATVSGEDVFSPVIQADSTTVIIGVSLVSILFGAIIAGLARASNKWANRGMDLSSSPSSTAWLGAFIGLLLGIIAGALLTSGFGTEVEGSEGLVQLPVLPTLSVMLIGGAVLGGLTAAVTQAVAVPVAVEEEDREEVGEVKHRLGGALTIPMTAMGLLILLVLPLAWALIESNHLTGGGAALVGILAASGILGFAALAGTKPQMKIGFGEVMVAVIGIGVLLLLVFAVLFARNPAEDHEAEDGEEAAAVLVIG